MAEYSICNCLRTDKPQKRNGKYPIYLRVRVGAKSSKIPSGLDVFLAEWNARDKQPKCKALLILLNKKIMELDLYLNRCMADGQTLSMDLVKSFYNGKREVKPEMESFYAYYLDFVERKRKEGLNPETIRISLVSTKNSEKFFEVFEI